VAGLGARNSRGMTTSTGSDIQTSSLSLAGRVAVVTGATSGIGRATARRLAADGAAVAVVGRREELLRQLVDELGDNALPVAADVSDRAAVERAAASIHDSLGRVDLVVAGAGAMLAAPFEEADQSEWDRMLDTNLRGLLSTGRTFANDLIDTAGEGERADLVHVGSIGGHTVFPTYGVYGATKAAVAHLTRNLRAELGPRGVRVKTIEPGLVRTELGDDMQHEAGRSVLEELKSQVEPIEPEQIAAAIAYAVAAPADVNVAELVVVPTRQG
jgi:NADP-dependent 3-hydroxy acid dehydrogenase YdfG